MLATELKRCITSGKMPKFERSYKLGPKDPAKGRMPSAKVSAMIVRDIKKGTTTMYDLWPWPHVAARIMELLKRPQRASKQRVGKPRAEYNFSRWPTGAPCGKTTRSLVFKALQRNELSVEVLWARHSQTARFMISRYEFLANRHMAAWRHFERSNWLFSGLFDP